MNVWVIAGSDLRNYELDEAAVRNLFQIAAGMEDYIRQEAEAAQEQEDENEAEELVEERAVDAGTDASTDYGPPYSGFLYVQCSKCGASRGFCTKKPITHSACRECGNVTRIKAMKPLYMRCPDCGVEFKYKTNTDADTVKMKCIRCGSEVEVSLNSRKTAYVTRMQPARRSGFQGGAETSSGTTNSRVEASGE